MARPRLVVPTFPPKMYDTAIEELKKYWTTLKIIKVVKKKIEYVESEMKHIKSVELIGSGLTKWDDYCDNMKSLSTEYQTPGIDLNRANKQELLDQKVLLEAQLDKNKKYAAYVENILNQMPTKPQNYKLLLIEAVCKSDLERLDNYLLGKKLKMADNTYKKHRKRALNKYIQLSNLML